MGLFDLFRRSGPSGFGSSSTAEEVTEGVDASNLTAIVTGATSGILRANVIIPVRNLESGSKKQCRYGRFKAYSRSKLANILHANELARHLQEEGANITANSLHPGVIATPLARYIELNKVILSSLFTLAKPFLKNIPQGAATTCYVALYPDLKGVSGVVF